MGFCLYLDSHLVEEVTGVADFVIGSLKLRLQLVHPFLTLLQLALQTQSTKGLYNILHSFLLRCEVLVQRMHIIVCGSVNPARFYVRTWSSWFLV